MEQKLQKILRKAGYRLTEPRQQVFSCLSRTETAHSIGEITKLCPDIDRTSIYRTLELFVKLGITHIVPRGWKHSYELSEPFRPHHHHFTCDSCGEVLSIMSASVEHVIKQLQEAQGVEVRSHTFEVQGMCRTCSELSVRSATESIHAPLLENARQNSR